MPGPDLLLLIVVLPIAVVTATLVGGMLGRRIRDAMDGEPHPRRPPRRPGATVAVPPPRPAAPPPATSPDPADMGRPDGVPAAAILGTAAAVTAASPRPDASHPSPGFSPVAADPFVPAPAAAPDPSSLVADPDAMRRLAGLPPPVSTRVPSSMSPAMRDRNGVPLTAGAIGAAREDAPEPALAPRPVDRGVAAAAFTLDRRPPQATATPRPPAPVATPPTPAPALGSSRQRPSRRTGMAFAALSGAAIVALLAVGGVLPFGRG